MRFVTKKGIFELLAKYEPALREHVTEVKQSQEEGTIPQAHHLSQNEIIEACSDRVT